MSTAGFAEVWARCLSEPREFRARPLEQRLRAYKVAIWAGCIPGLREGVAAMSASYAGWYERDRWRRNRAMVPPGPCSYCGAPDARHVDHVIPRCQGGTNDMSNLARACRDCNLAKGSRTPEQWRRGDSVKLYWPSAGPAATPRS